MILLKLIDVYSLIVFITVILSWIPDARNTKVAGWLEKATEPALAPIRKVVPLVGGFDLSPLVLLVVLSILRRLLASFL